MVEIKGKRPISYSRALSQRSLRAEDVRIFSNAFKIPDFQAVMALLQVGLTGEDIKVLQPRQRRYWGNSGEQTERVSRRNAVRQAINCLTDSERKLIMTS